ncbi:hypothetical protein CCE28_03205 [Anaeromicrobium sediminis]|uniref:2-hydroxyglutaryl-CoA dehydratase n=2 Tax=Anaeromicrobium sediminis TaxID=1478221 RepID=A0A267MLZ8_9FIRM|nr:hypothetical protein CCE28_03205 [Anaeromicrobium sediminis]
MSKVYREFLELCAFDESEIEELLPLWIEGSKKLGLTEEDVAYAKDEWIPEHWDIQYLGIRKMLGAYIREAIEISKLHQYKEDGVKIVYGIIPAISTNYYAIKAAGKDKVFVTFPDIHLVTILNGIFHKVDDYLYKAEEDGMTYGCRHCALNKTRIGAKANNIIPSPDVIWSWGLNCDEGPKTDEYIAGLYGEDWKYVVSRIPHDTPYGHVDDEDDERVEYLAEVLKDGQKEIEKIIGIDVSDEHLAQAVKDQAKYSFKYSQLVSLVCKSNPQVIHGSALTNFGQPMAIPFNSGQKYMEEAMDIMIRECKKARKAGTGVLPKDAPKLGSYFVPFAVPWVDKIFDENGIGTTFSLTFTPAKSQLKPSRFEDPFKQTAEAWLKMSFGQNMGYEVANMIDKVESNKPFDGLLLGFFDFDRWLGAHHKMAAKLIEKETGVPTFYMESDFWDDRDYSPEALRTRIESIAQVIKLKKEASK